jgi:hypothetical protein
MVSNAAAIGKLLQRIGFALAGICLIGLPAVSHATNNCAWLNEATASGFLGSEAVGTFTEAAAGQPAICSFVSQSDGATRTLRLTVEVTPEAHARVSAVAASCGPDAVPMKAIGNEALFCATDDRKSDLGERVIGRVRDQFFTITISTTLKADPILTRDALKAKIYSAAEQISANLF